MSTDTSHEHQIQAWLEKNEMKIQDQSIIKSILNIIKEYKLEKKFICDFFQSKGNDQAIIQTLPQVYLFSLYFNIKSSIARLFEKNKLLGYQAFCNTISKSLLRYTEANHEKKSKSDLSNVHYPLKLPNAMLCQNCHRKRTYLYCQ